MLFAVSLPDDRLKFSLHLFFGEVECPLGSAACLLEPSLIRLVSRRQVGPFQPRFEIGVHAHGCFSFRTVSRFDVGSGSVVSARAIVRRRPRPWLSQGKPASIWLRLSWRP